METITGKALKITVHQETEAGIMLFDQTRSNYMATAMFGYTIKVQGLKKLCTHKGFENLACLFIFSRLNSLISQKKKLVPKSNLEHSRFKKLILKAKVV